MRLPLQMLEVFTAIVENGNLRRAASALGVKPSTVSHQLKNLEDRVGAQLVIRSPRSCTLTEAGRVLIDGTGPAFQQMQQAFEDARMSGKETRGALRLTMPELAYQLLVAPRLNEFRDLYPQIDIEFSIDDALDDIRDTGFHAGFRSGEILSEDMVAIRMTDSLKLAVAGSTQYFEIHGKPNSPSDLLRHNCIRYRFISSGQFAPWMFKGSPSDYSIEVSGDHVVNSLPVAVDGANRGIGLVFVLEQYIQNEIEAGTLELVLQKDMTHTAGLYLYYPLEYRNHRPLRAFVDYLKDSTKELRA